jgi:predicted PurR-regulated permease PerM
VGHRPVGDRSGAQSYTVVMPQRKSAPPPAPAPRAIDSVPVGMQIAGAWAWRILLIAGVVALFVWLIITFRIIVVPMMVAVLLAALLVPLVGFLTRHRWPRWLAIVVAEVGTLGIVTGLVVLIVTQIRSGWPDLQAQTLARYDDLKVFLLESPLHITESQLSDLVAQGVDQVQRDSEFLVSGALSVGSSAGHFLAGLLLALFATLFILIDGRGLFGWFVRLFPRRARTAVGGAGRAGWITLTTFVKVQIFVAAVDAVGIGLGAYILGLFYGGFPLVIPIAIAVFLGSFIPFVGAVVTGALAVFVALIYLGPIPALIMLGIVLLVQQIEGHVLQPLIMGTAVKVHPLAVVLAVASGSMLAGIPGALFAVPVVATLNVMVGYIARGEWRTDPRPTEKDLLPRE